MAILTSQDNGCSGVNFDALPVHIKPRKQFVMWRYEDRGGKKLTKPPYKPSSLRPKHNYAKSNDPATWSDLATCRTALASGRFSGIGFCFCKGDDLSGVDLDNCLDEIGLPESWAQEILDRFANTYMEITPSFKGFHILCKGKPLVTGERKWKKKNSDEDQGIEVYDFTSPRYFTLSTNRFNSNEIADGQAGLDWLYQEHFAGSKQPEQPRREDNATDLDDAEAAAILEELPATYPPPDEELVRLALSFLPADNRADWIARGHELKKSGLPDEVAFRLWNEWSAKSTEYDANDMRYRWAGFKATRTGIGALFRRAKDYGFKFPVGHFKLDDIGNAERFVYEHGDQIRYFVEKKVWLIWNGKVWVEDPQVQILAYAQQTARNIFHEAAECKDAELGNKISKWAHTSASVPKVEAMVKLARPAVAVTADMLDTDTYLLNCENGTINLRTGILQTYRQENLITKLAPVEYHPDAEAPRFKQFLNEIFDNSNGLIEYVQKFFGYGITGDVTEQKLPVAHGTGANGKGVLFGIVQELFGDYAQQADPSLLLVKTFIGGASPEVARLRGIRFATAVETNRGALLDEAIVKWLTGDDRITARFLHANPVEFSPMHKIFLVSNYKPKVRHDDPAVWRRIVLIPFTVVIPLDKRDPKLKEKLRQEKAGILRWLVEGCLRWQQEGLGDEPPEVSNATSAYRAEMDLINIFLGECCYQDEAAKVGVSILYGHYKGWCASKREPSISSKEFKQKMETLEFKQKKFYAGMFWLGVGLLKEEEDFERVEEEAADTACA